VLVTAIPAMKSRKVLPSKSSINIPSARLITKGYSLMSDGDETLVSLFIILLDSGPGRGVSILGVFNMI
jgi:hypothetical protein